MSDIETSAGRPTTRPLPASFTSAQPGGGVCFSIEMAWGRWRRWYLQRFRRAYVERMGSLREGDAGGCPHPVLDPRDLKFFRGLCTARWQADDDPFAWREHLGFARWGLAELVLGSAVLAALTVVLALVFWPLTVAAGVIWVWWLSFFRDPRRQIPGGPGIVVSPADGRVAEVTPVDYDERIGGPGVRIGIFLSIFNVHINRAPMDARVVELAYHPGKFLNALNPASSWENESVWIGFEETAEPHRRLVVRQVAGLFARRIVCELGPGMDVERGEKFGMIKLGSRTELILPAATDLKIETTVGAKVSAGSSILARYTV